MYSIVNQNPVTQAKYELLSGMQAPYWKTRVLCLIITLLIICFLFITCLWFGIILLQSSQSELEVILSEEQDKNDQIASWVHRALMYAESTKENQSTDRNTTVILPKKCPHKNTGKAVVCYYTIPQNFQTSWDLIPSRIDPYICTHIIVGFATVLNCTLNLGDNAWIYEKVVDLKTLVPKLKVMISAGGMNNFHDGFSEMVKNHANRKKFIRSVLNITKMLQMDGLDLDWEFPAWLGNDKGQKIYFVQLIKELRKEFDHSGQELLLSVAVASPQAIVDQSYDVSDMEPYIDFINLMAYDYHFYVWYFPVTGLNAPLYGRSTEIGYLSTLNVNFSAQYWIAKGMPREKIIVGIPTYGHSYRLDNSLNHNLGAPATGIGTLGFSGFVPFATVCEFLRDGAKRIFESESRVPYAYKNLEWISYDDVDSVYYKAEWIRLNNFKGAMVFSLNEDDWNGTCVLNETFPLTRLLSNIFRKSDTVH